MFRVLLLPLALPVMQAHAEDLAGMVKVSKGPVSIEREGKKVDAVVGTPILVSDRVRTGNEGAVGITLRDNTLISDGPNASVVMDKFAYDTTTQKGNVDVSIGRGTVSVVSGKIAKASPEAVAFRTPSSVLGLRGTEFIVEVAGGNE